MKYTADIKVLMTVEFEDDHENDLRDQAIDAAKAQLGYGEDYDLSVVGRVEPIKGRG